MSGRVLGERYQLDGVLGRGGMATVWRGWDLRLERPVAVKVLDPTVRADPAAVERFAREARTLARLAHPTIVTGYDYVTGHDHATGSDGEVSYLVMELVEGESLRAVLARGPLGVQPAVAIAAQVCAAMGVAHAAGVVHRDIKPANILVTAAGEVKVCDFGIARTRSATGSQVSLTGPLSAVGTSDYMAPEQLMGGPVDGRTDLYALGCVLYAMLTGTPPFTGDDPVGVAFQHRFSPPVPLRYRLSGLPEGLDTLVGQLLAKDPAARPSGAAEVDARLAALAGWSGPAAHRAMASTIAAAVAHREGSGGAPLERTEPPVASLPAGPATGTAAVASPTRSLPIGDVHLGYGTTGYAGAGWGTPRAGGGVRVGLAGVAAVAVGAAVLAGLVVTLLTSYAAPGPYGGGSAGPQTSAAGVAPASTAAEPSTTAGPASALDVLADLRRQLTDGGVNLDERNTAQDLDDRLDEILRYLHEGELDKAAEKVAELRTRVAKLHRDGKLDAASYQVARAGLDQLAGTLPPPRGRGGD